MCIRDRPLAVAVSRIAQLGGHELFKDKVDACHHLRGGAEVRIQRQQSVSACRTLLLSLIHISGMRTAAPMEARRVLGAYTLAQPSLRITPSKPKAAAERSLSLIHI